MNRYSEQNRGETSAKVEQAAPVQKAQPTDTPAKPAAGVKTVQVPPVMAGKGKWPQQVKAAKNQWGKLSEAEILKSDGDAQQLSGLVQQRYAITRDVADKQVKSFLDRCDLA